MNNLELTIIRHLLIQLVCLLESKPEKEPFVTEKDYQVFRDNDDCLETCILSFKQDMPAFLEKVWRVDEFEEDIIKLRESKDVLETFNEIIEYQVLRLPQLWTTCLPIHQEFLDMLSPNTYTVIGYFYDIILHEN